MIGLALLVASIAIADAINPSTIVPALWLASSPSGRGLVSFTLGVFAVYLVGGLALVLGPGPALIAALHHVGGPLEHALQAAGGLVAIAFAYALWRSRNSHDNSTEPRARRAYTPASGFALGAGIMAIELPTAFMYFGAISAILTAHPAVAVEILLLIAYNALFVAPLFALLAIRRLAADRAARWLTSADVRLRRFGQLALGGAAGAGGTALLVIGTAGLLAT
jgi:cytochrome c biogenesis protein CcdA